MRHFQLAAIIVVSTLAFGGAAWACEGHAAAAPAANKAGKVEKAAATEGDYVCPMGPACSGYLKAPGECPKCGMKLVRKEELKK